MNDCIFCKVIVGELPSTKVYEDENVFAFLDIKPNNPGHTLVIPRAHYRNIFDTPEDVLAAMTAVGKRLAGAVRTAVNADGINLAVNNEPAAGQIIFHMHLHVIPRFTSDGFKPWQGKAYGEGEREAVAEKIKGVLTILG